MKAQERSASRPTGTALRQPLPACWMSRCPSGWPGGARRSLPGRRAGAHALVAGAAAALLLRRSAGPAAISPASRAVDGETGRGRARRGGDRRPRHLCRREAPRGRGRRRRQGASARLAVQPRRPEAGGAGSDRRRLRAGRRPAAAGGRSNRPRMLLYEDDEGRPHFALRHGRVGGERQGHLQLGEQDGPQRRLLAGQGLWLRRRRHAAARADWPRWPRAPTASLLAGCSSKGVRSCLRLPVGAPRNSCHNSAQIEER